MFERMWPITKNAAVGTMLTAALLFALQGTIRGYADAAAVDGATNFPAVSVSGNTHVHGHIAGHVHTHDDGDEEGHTHTAHDYGDENPDGQPHQGFSSFAVAYGVVPSGEPAFVRSTIKVALSLMATDHLIGAKLDGPRRPPRTPSIA